MDHLAAEVLIIGSGPGGAITAALLAEAGQDVLVGEEGAYTEPQEVAPFSPAQMSAQYRNAGLTVALGRPPIAYAEARCVGGGSEINSGLYHRPPQEVLEEWRREWRVADLDPDVIHRHCQVIEEDLGVAVLDAEAPSASKVLANGAARLRWSAQEVPRWARMADGRLQRQSMTRTYLPRARAAGARVVENLRVERLHWAGDRVVGASAVAMDGDGPRSVDIRAERVFVCAGAVQTPALLRRSGMRGQIGETLYVHPTVKVAARFDRPIDGHDDVPVHQVKEFAPQLSFGGSASRPGFISLALSDNWLRDGRLADQWRNMAIYYAAIRPSGHGRVTSVPYVTDPLVTYRINRADISLLRSGLLRLTHLLLEAGASSVHPAVPGAPAATRTVDIPEVGRAFRRSAAVLMTVHLCSTVPMGEDLARCPADSWGKLRGTKNLYVNDASLLPNAPGVNPQGTIMVLAARNAAHYLAEVGR